MNLHGKDIKIFAGNSNKDVAYRMAKELGLPVGKSDVVTFSDGEISCSIFESVRGFLISSKVPGSGPPDFCPKQWLLFQLLDSVAGLIFLTGAADGHGSVRHILGDGGTGRRIGAVPNPHRGDEVGIAADKGLIPYGCLLYTSRCV